MRYFVRNDWAAGAPKRARSIFLVLVGILMLLSEPVQPQQEVQEQSSAGKCPLPVQELDTLIDLLNTIGQTSNSAESNADYAEESDETLDAESRLAARCARELKLLREAISEVQSGYHYFKKNANDTNIRWYRVFHGRYVEFKEQFIAQMDKVTKLIRAQDDLQLTKLRNKYVEVVKQLNQTETMVAEQRQHLGVK